MPPRLSLPRSPITWSLTLGASLAVASAVFVLSTGSAGSAATADRTTTVKRGVVQATVTGSGNLAPAKEVELNFGTSGKVTKVYVREGEHVSSGQLVARMANASQRADLLQAQADLEAAETALEAAGGSVSTVDASADSAGTAVLVNAVATEAATVTTPEQATTPATPTPTPTTASGTGPSSSGSASSNSTSSPSGSSGSGGSSGAAAAGATGGSASGGTTSTSEASAEATYLKAKLAVEEAEEALSETELRAPVPGTITDLAGAVGDQVSGSGSSTTTSGATSSSSGSGTGSGATGGSTSASSTAFAVLSQLSKLSMSVSLSESDIGTVKVGQAVTVTVSALDDVQLAARVTTVGLTGSTSNSVVSYPVELTLSQTSAGVRAGMSAEAEIVVKQATGVLTVPTQALSGRSLTVVDDDGNTTTATVTVGITGDTTTQILSGVSAGDTVKLPTLTTSSSSSGSGATSQSSQPAQAAGGFGGIGGGAAGGPPSGGGMPAGGMPTP